MRLFLGFSNTVCRQTEVKNKPLWKKMTEITEMLFAAQAPGFCKSFRMRLPCTWGFKIADEYSAMTLKKGKGHIYSKQD